METALIWLTLILIGACLLMMVGFGLKNSGTILSGSKLGLAAFALPVVILLVLFAISQGAEDGAWTTAAVLTAAVMTVLGIVALVVFGAKSLFS